ncbi:MAG: YHYH protein [Acidobacteriota bacterium]
MRPLTSLAVLVLFGSTAQAQCPTDQFPAPSAHPANSDYPDPTLSVSCTATEVVVSSNGIPSYEFVLITRNDLEAQNYDWRFPLNPVLPAEAEDIPLLGTMGIAINGLPLFGPNEAEVPDPYGDPVYNGIMDSCLGHTAQRGTYHYHALLVDCLTSADVDGEPSPIIGYAFDGFPIYGPWGCLDADCNEVIEFQSGWVQTGDPSTYAWDNHEYQEQEGDQYLDRCNGRIGPDGSYRYHATSTFPYILGCYAGENILRETTGSDVDFDGDGVENTSDNCELYANAGQADTDMDGLGDACEHLWGDCAPAGAPDGNVDISDVVHVLRIAVGLVDPSDDELRRGNVAPAQGDPLLEPTLEDPRTIDIADVVMVLRMAVGLVEFGEPY